MLYIINHSHQTGKLCCENTEISRECNVEFTPSQVVMGGIMIVIPNGLTMTTNKMKSKRQRLRKSLLPIMYYFTYHYILRNHIFLMFQVLYFNYKIFWFGSVFRLKNLQYKIKTSRCIFFFFFEEGGGEGFCESSTERVSWCNSKYF